MDIPLRRIAKAARIALWALPLSGVIWLTTYVVDHHEPAPVPQPTELTRFGLTKDKRKAVFEDIAEWVDRWRRWSKHDFPNDEWSREDHYHNLLRMHVEKLDDRHDLNYGVVYLIYDEGIRKGWKTPSGHPLRPTTVPLDPPSP